MFYKPTDTQDQTFGFFNVSFHAHDLKVYNALGSLMNRQQAVQFLNEGKHLMREIVGQGYYHKGMRGDGGEGEWAIRAVWKGFNDANPGVEIRDVSTTLVIDPIFG